MIMRMSLPRRFPFIPARFHRLPTQFGRNASTSARLTWWASGVSMMNASLQSRCEIGMNKVRPHLALFKILSVRAVAERDKLKEA